VVSGRCSVRLTRRYAASPEEVWAALTESDSLRRWLDPSCEISLEEGASFGVGEGRITGRVRALEPQRLLELDWDTGRDPSVVRFELSTDGTETVLVLDHERIEESAGMTYMRQWTQALDRLDREVEP
jgi:uncharacterized protein YndB with AHSA1/START domain